MYDVIIIGAGPAGISASLYLIRAKKNILVISKDNSSLKKAEKIDNYYGLESLTGKELFDRGIKQAKELGVNIVKEEVISVDFEDIGKFKVITENKEYMSKNVIIATGTSRKTPNIKGIKEYEGKGVSYCAICDAFFYKNKDVAVIGSGNYAIHEAKTLKDVANSVSILTNGEQVVQNRDDSLQNFDINEKRIKEVRGFNKVEEIDFDDDTSKKVSGVFIAMGTASADDLAKKLGVVLKNNSIQVDENMQTNIKGIYACGDCTGGLLQINKAVYEGAKAALHIIANNKL